MDEHLPSHAQENTIPCGLAREDDPTVESILSTPPERVARPRTTLHHLNTIIVLTTLGFVLLGGCRSPDPEASADPDPEASAEAETPTEQLEAEGLQVPAGTWPDLFGGMPPSQGTWKGKPIVQGDVGCLVKGNSADHDWQSWTHTTSDSLNIEYGAGVCRTINTWNTCRFDLGQGAVTNLSFDYSVDASCYPDAWFSFWFFNYPWSGSQEVDMIESLYPGQGLWINFDGNPPGVSIPKDQGTITVAVTGQTGSAVDVVVTETTSNASNSKTIQPLTGSDTGYFLVFDTAAGGSQSTSCSITISNLTMTGTAKAAPYDCANLISP